jgi:hypothetical protein
MSKLDNKKATNSFGQKAALEITRADRHIVYM